MERPQSSLGDFYRELGSLFGVNLSPANRYGGFKTLRERWQDHIKSTLFRPVLIIDASILGFLDEAQEMFTGCLNASVLGFLDELRLLASTHFDSQSLLTTILCGDMRLPERFRSPSLLSLGSRIRVRLVMEPYGREVLIRYLDHCLTQAGAAHLMTNPLVETLVDHAAGNLRLLAGMAADLLEKAAEQEIAQLDEKLFLEVFSRTPAPRRNK